jgi:hypothetical protein
MRRRCFSDRIDRCVNDCDPTSTAGAVLLARYAESLDRSRTNSADAEIIVLRELCSLVEDPTVTLEPLTVDRLRRIAQRPAPSRTAAERRRRLASRLIALLQKDGIFPDSGELHASRSVMRTLAPLPDGRRSRVARWIEEQREYPDGRPKTGWGQLLVHARALAELETLLEDLQLDSEECKDAVGLWLERVVREIVDCGCPPVTRARTPHHCHSCGATPTTHGTRPSPALAKQRELEALARRYLDWAFPTYEDEAA